MGIWYEKLPKKLEIWQKYKLKSLIIPHLSHMGNNYSGAHNW